MKRKSILLAAAVSASLSAYAAVPTGAAPFQIVVPNLKSGVEFTLEGLYLQPTESDLDYAGVANTVSSSPTFVTNADVETLNPDYNFGFRVGLGYVFPDSGNDVQLSWFHFDNDTTDNANFLGSDTGSGVVITPVFGFWELESADSSVAASSRQDVQVDAIDLDVGQYISIGTRLTARLFAGLRYAQVKSDITNTYSGNFPEEADEDEVDSVTGAEVDYFNSKFNGIGPRFGVDTSYNVWDCFGVVGHFAAAFLVGQVESSTNASFSTTTTDSGFSTVTGSSLSVTADNSTRVVPVFDAKLGLDYSWPFANDTSRLSIEAGYQWTQYIDVVDHLEANGSGSFVRNTSSLGFNGPYLSLNYKM